MFLVKTRAARGDEYAHTFGSYGEALAFAIDFHGDEATREWEASTPDGVDCESTGERLLERWNQEGEDYAEVIEVREADPCAEIIKAEILASWPRYEEGLPEKFYMLSRYHSAKHALKDPEAGERYCPETVRAWEVIVAEGIERYGWPAGTTLEDAREVARQHLETLSPDKLVGAYSAMKCQAYR